MLREGKVYNLLLCVKCGPQELLVSEDSARYLESFLAKGETPEGHHGDWLFKKTTSTCPSCLALLEADVVIRDKKVFFKKACNQCGPSEALVSEDATLLRPGLRLRARWHGAAALHAAGKARLSRGLWDL